jgi:cyclopropane-fatty-acyl-phospholipid synthase
MTFLQVGIDALERGLVPDALARRAIRALCRQRLSGLNDSGDPQAGSQDAALRASMESGPIALVPDKANEQHYELPPEFFAAILGPRRKYSCCYFPNPDATLADAEAAALAATCERAQLTDGQQILELGCGWGSLSLWMAQRYPRSRITAVSNSVAQRRFIESEALRRGLGNVTVVTADMNEYSPVENLFDRVVSVEMFEHMRNYDQLLERVASWLQPGGKLFVHIFCHRNRVYAFDSQGEANWMGRYFFTGGIMPSADLLRQFDRNMNVVRQWTWSGLHYQKTADAWLARFDARHNDILPILTSVYGAAEARRWLHRWRTFFLAVSELFGYAAGEEWFVSHYLLEPVAVPCRVFS